MNGGRVSLWSPHGRPGVTVLTVAASIATLTLEYRKAPRCQWRLLGLAPQPSRTQKDKETDGSSRDVKGGGKVYQRGVDVQRLCQGNGPAIMSVVAVSSQ